MHECASVAHKWAGLSICTSVPGRERSGIHGCASVAHKWVGLSICTFVVDAEWLRFFTCTLLPHDPMNEQTASSEKKWTYKLLRS